LLEKEIIRILLLYGNEEVDFVDLVEVEDEKGNIKVEKEPYKSKISKELYLNLQEDEIEFTHPVFQSVYYELIHQLNQDESINIDQLTNHKNADLANEVTSILMDEEKYSLSDWERKNIYVTEIQKILPKLVTDAILNLRRVLIERKVSEIMEEAKANPSGSIDLELVTNYTELKKRLFQKLNRVV